ncbi:uncharacterized protein UBRO_20355 [Ustilago bromivora]|uniref:Uncharacterized protein n=1 Tax=Ustilago bromivora TaxID=307758 RepID=A0A1K0GS23_9BASI|nr:uncharacterized protein UBRO_20355 [Ustilago bromivora]
MPFSPLPSSLPLPASTLSLAEPSTLTSAPTTAMTAAASAPSCLTPPLPPTIFLTKDSPSANTAGSALGAPLPGESDMDHIFSWLSQEVVQQVIDDALPPQDLGRLHNPDSFLVDNEHKHAVLVNNILIKSIPSTDSTSSTCHFTKLIPNICCFAEAWTIYTCIRACTTNDPNLGTSLGAFLLHIIQTDHMHMWLSVASYVLTTCRRCFGHASAALWAQQDQAAWNQHLSTAASFRPPPKSATPGSTNHQANTQPSGPPLKHQKDLELCFQYNGLAWLVGDSASTLNLGTPLLQGSAQSVIMPAGLGGTRTPPLQGLAQLFDLVLAALDAPSADCCLSLLLNMWSHDPGLCPNTSFASNVFDPASQPVRHGSMQECAFAWSTLLTTALPSVNASISLGFIRIQYKGLQDLLAFVSQNPGCLLWKGDLEDTFRHVMTAECNTHLLSFSYNSICYHKNTLTFRGSSSPWLFNLVAEFLHWLVAACLPADWPFNHYLDDTFGAIPVSQHALLPRSSGS